MREMWALLSVAMIGVTGCTPAFVESVDEHSMRTVWPDGGDLSADEWLPRGLRRTRSGYYSWLQPDSAVRGWEGRCGQTAMANIAWHCGYNVSPTDAIRLVPDLTPGTRPGRLATGLNKIAGGDCGEFRVCRPDVASGAQPLRWLQDKVQAYGRGYPTPVLITEGNALHWMRWWTFESLTTVLARWCIWKMAGNAPTMRLVCSDLGAAVQPERVGYTRYVLGRYTAICRRGR